MAFGEYKKLYATKAWQQLRTGILARDGYMCQRCGVMLTQGRKHKTAAVVNHKTPHKGDLELFYDVGNLEAVCKHCHDGKIQRQERGNRTTIGADGWPIERG